MMEKSGSTFAGRRSISRATSATWSGRSSSTRSSGISRTVGYDVTFVINVTDVDDKLIAESNSRGMKMAELAAEMTQDYMNNLDAMGVDSVDHFPYATENMDEIIALTKSLVDQDFAYESKGDVYFDVTKCKDYGKLSGRKLDETLGDGGGTAELKRNSADFALWKSAKKGEPSWDSPWGPGRPGWHIECSAMSRKILGKTFDIHGGGLGPDLPAPRKRDRPKRVGSWCPDGEVLDAQRPDASVERGRQGRRSQDAFGRRG